MKKIDCLGEMCPIPIMLLHKELDYIKVGSPIMLVTDHSCTVSSMKEFCKMYNLHAIYNEVMYGVWEITISNKPI